MGVKFIGKTAYNAIYESKLEDVYVIALHYSGNHHAAEEITQTVFMKLYMNMENINMDALEGWLYTTTKHTALYYNRIRNYETPVEDIQWQHDNEKYADSTDEEFFRKLQQKEYVKLKESIFADLLEENERWYDAVMLTYYLEKPHKEVAEIMEISLEGLYSMLYRAKKWIRKRYEEEYGHLNKA